MRTPVRLKPDATDVTEAVARPRLAEWLLRRALPRGVRGETILGDPSRSGARAAGGAPRPFGIGDTRCLSRHVTADAASAASSRPRPATEAVFLDNLRHDVRYAFRSYAKAPSFALGSGLGSAGGQTNALVLSLSKDEPWDARGSTGLTTSVGTDIGAQQTRPLRRARDPRDACARHWRIDGDLLDGEREEVAEARNDERSVTRISDCGLRIADCGLRY